MTFHQIIACDGYDCLKTWQVGGEKEWWCIDEKHYCPACARKVVGPWEN